MRLEHKAIIDRIKLTAYGAGEWLGVHYPNPYDGRRLLRFFAGLSGEIRSTARRVAINLGSASTPHYREARRGPCTDLGELRATLPEQGLPVAGTRSWCSVPTLPPDRPMTIPLGSGLCCTGAVLGSDLAALYNGPYDAFRASWAVGGWSAAYSWGTLPRDGVGRPLVPSLVLAAR